MNPYKANDIIIFDEERTLKHHREDIIQQCGQPPYTILSVNEEWCRIKKKNGGIDGWPYPFFRPHHKPVQLDEELFTL